MLRFQFERPPTRVLCLGAHCDDLEIGCSGTVMKLAKLSPALEVTWVVFSSDDVREAEARASAAEVLGDVARHQVLIKRFRDGFFPAHIGDIKEEFEALKQRVSPDLVLTHWRGDLHQDHRTIGELTWNTFRDHVILEYEIPKYDGDFGSPNVFVTLDEAMVRRKVDNLLQRFPSQRGRSWFSGELFTAVMRLRGMEAEASATYAEAFYCRKAMLGWGSGG
jgi:LmbE family N-acetylglucosaminyl deacetylase